MKPVSAGSKMDLLLAKAEPISDGGSTSEITYLRRGEKSVKMAVERGVRYEGNNSADTKGSGEGGAGGAPDAGADFLQPMEKIMVRQAVPLQSMEVHSGADLHWQPREESMPEQGGGKRGCDPVGSPRCRRLLARPVDLWREEPTLEQVCWQDL